MFYSPSTQGFYTLDVWTSENIPADAVAITPEEHTALLKAQCNAQVIVPSASGKPVAKEAEPPPFNAVHEAQACLTASDRVVLRCYENGVRVPLEWVSYRAYLRDIVTKGDVTVTLPKAPMYPDRT